MDTDPAAGEADLAVLLRELQPVLHEGEFVFCTLPHGDLRAAAAIAWFREEEGVTLIVPRAHADTLGLSYDFVAGWITLRIHSALTAVGLTAAVARALADAGISANIVAAYYHDHIFVPIQEAGRAMATLQTLSATAH